MLLPGMQTGGLYLVGFDAAGRPLPGEPRMISTPLAWWWYAAAPRFVDLNRDGRLDILTPRAMYDFDHGVGQLIWLENPAQPDDPWIEHNITAGPDVAIDIAHLGSGASNSHGCMHACMHPRCDSHDFFL